jgi:RHS repeat-associated protein
MESGGVTWTGAYYPFGEMSTGSGNVHGFTGKELDSEMDLNYFCQRYYDPQTGRFTQVDPISAAVLSPYAYCYANPLKYIDLSGMSTSEWVHAACASPWGGGSNGYDPWGGNYTWYMGSFYDYDPEFWCPGWDYRCDDPFFRNIIMLLGSSYGDVEIITAEGVYFLNIGEIIRSLNLQVHFTQCPPDVVSGDTYGWGDVWKSDTDPEWIIGMKNNKINLNIDWPNDPTWKDNARYEAYIAAIAHEATHHWLASTGPYTLSYHEGIANWVTGYFYPMPWPMIYVYKP